jgi:hypothetical protein
LAQGIVGALADPQLLAACRRFQTVIKGFQAEERTAKLVAARLSSPGVG